MSATGLDVFDRTLHITNTWLDEIMQEHGPDRQRAWHMLGAVLRATRDRLPVELAAHLGAQLPLLVRGTYYDQFKPANQPHRERTLEAFLDAVGEGLHGTPPVNPDAATRSVFRTLARHIDDGQARKVRNALPDSVRALWPEVEAEVGAG